MLLINLNGLSIIPDINNSVNVKNDMSRYKYPRTPHLPWSHGATNDDKQLLNCDHFHGHEVVVTEKFDGENCTLYCDGLHARSLDSRGHTSRDWVKRYQGEVGWTIPHGWRVCGENLFAKHSIHYTQLKSFFLVFGVYTAENVALSWDDTLKFADERGMHTVTSLYTGAWDEKKLRALKLNTSC
jgi:hypothetical protein